MTGSSGESYSMAQFGLQADIVFKISTEKDEKTGKETLTLTGESANDQSNQIAAFSATFTGRKLSDEITELK